MLSSPTSTSPAQSAGLPWPARAGAAGPWIVLGLVLVLGAALRLHALDLIDLRFDEASGARFGLRVANGEWFAALPNTGSVANHPPVYAYVMVIPYLVTREFMAVAAYRALIDVLALALCGWMCARHFGWRVAIVATLFYAVASWAVLFSRNLGVLPPQVFLVLLLWGILEVARRRNPWGWPIVGWGLALAVGSHWSAAYLIPTVVVAAVLRRRTMRPVPVLAGLAPGLAIAGAYVWRDASVGFANIHGLLSASAAGAVVDLDALWRAVWLSAGLHVSDLTGSAYEAWRAMTPAWLEAPGWAQAGLTAAGAVWLLVCAVRDAQVSRATQAGALDGRSNGRRPDGMDWSGLLLVLWCLFPIVLQLRHAQHVQMHYLLPIYPAPFIILARFIDSLLSWLDAQAAYCASPFADRRRVGGWLARVGVITGVVAVLAAQCFLYIRLMDFVASNDTGHGGYGPPARNALAISRLIRDAVCSGDGCASPRDVIVAAPGADPQVNEQAAIWDVVLAGVPRRFANSDAGLILRHDAAQYVFAPGSEFALARLRDWLAGRPVKVEVIAVPVRAGSASVITSLRVDADGFQLRPDTVRARWDNGVALLDSRVKVANDRSALSADLFLSVESAPPAGVDYHWFNHVLARGEKIAQTDGGGIYPLNWRAGDVLWHWFEIALPVDLDADFDADATRLRIGCYTYPQIQNVPVMLPDGSVGDGVEIPIGVIP